jgi:hypothetical protein
MPLVLITVYAILWKMFGLSEMLIIGAIIGTCGAVIVGAVRITTNAATRDRSGRWHDREGQFISSNSAYYGYATACAAMILPFVTKIDLFTNLVPQIATQFMNWSPETQAFYVLIVHGVGYGLSH